MKCVKQIFKPAIKNLLNESPILVLCTWMCTLWPGRQLLYFYFRHYMAIDGAHPPRNPVFHWLTHKTTRAAVNQSKAQGRMRVMNLQPALSPSLALSQLYTLQFTRR